MNQQNNEKYILVSQTSLVSVIKSLVSIDEVKGFKNMNVLVGCVNALQTILDGSPQVEVEEKKPVNPNVAPEIVEAAEAAEAEEASKLS